MKTIQQAQVKDKNVLIRIDADILNDDGAIKDDFRLRASIPTLKYLLENGAKLTIIGHIDRPGGKEVPELKMRPVEDKLIELLGTHNDWQILENLRFNPGEEKNDPEFAKQLAAGQDLFVQDAFATCHRAHASTVAITEILPSYAGLSIQKEVENLAKMLANKEKPFTAILGGSKISEKLPVIKNLMSRVDNFLIGGAIANTFLAARRHHMGKSLVEPNSFSEANIIWKNIMDEAKRNIFLPRDVMLSRSDKEPSETKTVEIKDLLQQTYDDFFAVDIGSKTIEQFSATILQSRTVFWNGNMGISEVPEFAEGTKKIAEIIGRSSAQVVIGGGDTVAAFEKLGIEKENIFLSTGGGATLEFLAGKQLPGLKVLNYYQN
jgi:phosphoglycerate kinase